MVEEKKFNDYVLSTDGRVAIIGGKKNGAFVSFNLPTEAKKEQPAATDPKLRPTSPIQEHPEVLQPDATVAFWGTDNLFPQRVMEDVEKDSIIGPTLNKKIKALYGGGLVYGINKIDPDTGVETFIRQRNPEIEAFLKRSNIKRYLLEAITDFYYFYNVFPELLLTADRTKIAAINVQEAVTARWSVQNKKTGLTDWCLISWDWASYPRGEGAKFVRVINPYWNAVEEVQKDKYFKYIYPISYPTPGKLQYQLAHWNALRESGWMEVLQYVPLFKKALFEQQISVKYHIRINVDFWKWKYDGEWENFKASEKRAKIKEQLAEIEATLMGVENAGKTISSPYWCDPDGKEHYYWDIIPIDDKIKDGIYIEDSQEASSHYLYALEMDPALIGHAPGSKMNNGGGSEKMIAFNIYLSLCEPERDCILEPLYFISDYNGWGDDLVWKFKNNIVNTVDAGVKMKDMTAANNSSQEKK